MYFSEFIEAMTFGTIDDTKTFDCSVKGCIWNETEVHTDWMLYGSGLGNPEAMNPVICAQRCALDINCGAFEYDSNVGIYAAGGDNYCSWWAVGVCDKGQGKYDFQTCAKVPGK